MDSERIPLAPGGTIASLQEVRPVTSTNMSLEKLDIELFFYPLCFVYTYCELDRSLERSSVALLLR